MPMEFDDVYFMRQAIREALKAYEADEVPVGAIVVSNNQIIARGHNLTEQLHDVTAHAEMQAITAASHYLGAKYLPDCTLYVTLEPCTMCAGALFWTQIGRIVYGASDEKRGFRTMGGQFHPKTQVTTGIEAEVCGDLMSEFFRSKRKK
ncbi:MAG: nucleoside deaminase [Bacteroidetes bacterium]|nr:nucleoside deaminase [Cryomorphaceae bacterium]MDA0363285.1 nucleoside deaminase [Bacteroidota bacterium]MDA0828778.1 nucleoside deaminase [Bacteroidota bacterium]MDA1198989.1 nucleoside deaminase [Bacteroidota bacterium]MDP5067694.1 nucleoside deaminase [Schleiferiaceae bacterium]